MQYLDLTLFVDHRPGFSAIAYLETMKANGVLPKKIICLAFTRARRVQQLSYVFGQSIAHRIFDQYLKRQQKKMFKFNLNIKKEVLIIIFLALSICGSIFLKQSTSGTKAPNILLFFFLSLIFSLIAFSGGIRCLKNSETFLWKFLSVLILIVSCINFSTIASMILVCVAFVLFFMIPFILN